MSRFGCGRRTLRGRRDVGACVGCVDDGGGVGVDQEQGAGRVKIEISYAGWYGTFAASYDDVDAPPPETEQHLSQAQELALVQQACRVLGAAIGNKDLYEALASMTDRAVSEKLRADAAEAKLAKIKALPDVLVPVEGSEGAGGSEPPPAPTDPPWTGPVPPPMQPADVPQVVLPPWPGVTMLGEMVAAQLDAKDRAEIEDHVAGMTFGPTLGVPTPPDGYEFATLEDAALWASMTETQRMDFLAAVLPVNGTEPKPACEFCGRDDFANAHGLDVHRNRMHPKKARDAAKAVPVRDTDSTAHFDSAPGVFSDRATFSDAWPDPVYDPVSKLLVCGIPMTAGPCTVLREDEKAIERHRLSFH